MGRISLLILVLAIATKYLATSFVSIVHECEFTKGKYKIKEIKESASSETNCKEICGEQDNCLVWQMQGNTCLLQVADVKKVSFSEYGIKNCNRGESAPACELSEGTPNLVRKRLKLNSSQDCKEKCDQMNDCLIWQFSKKNRKCELNRLRASGQKNSIFGISYCNEAASECSDEVYKILNDSTRSTAHGVEAYCDYVDKTYNVSVSDDWHGTGWYRFQEPAGIILAESPPGMDHCGTYAAGWTNSTLPAKENESADIIVCFQWYDSECQWSSQARATNCGSYNVYYLQFTQVCFLRYCGSQ